MKRVGGGSPAKRPVLPGPGSFRKELKVDLEMFTHFTSRREEFGAMKKLFFFFSLLLVAVASHAQTPSVSAVPTHADSVAHLRHVFQHARRFARFGAGASAVVLGAQALSFATDRASPARVALGMSLSAFYAYLLVDDARRWRRFSRRQENAAVRRLDAHQPQPDYVTQQVALAAAKGR